jgi:hypothetical protein
MSSYANRENSSGEILTPPNETMIDISKNILRNRKVK